MRYVSIDIETTGLNPETCSILSVGAIIEDTRKKLSFDEIPKFHVGILQTEVTGSLYALNLNHSLINTLLSYDSADKDGKINIEKTSGMTFCSKDDFTQLFYGFLWTHLTDAKIPVTFDSTMYANHKILYPSLKGNTNKLDINVAGKNFGTFDKLFLEKMPRWQQAIRIRQRIIDPSIFYCDWHNDESIPSLAECKVRAGTGEIVTHNALEDAWDIIELLRKQY